jgi:RHS repeat-associated protein
VKKNEFEKDQYFYHADQTGSSNYITDANGALYEHLEYFPFGESWVEESTNTQRTPYLFSGKELDEETGLYYYGARYYDPRTSQFISTDPLLQSSPGSATTMPALISLYAYAANNPLRYTDPSGGILKIIGDEHGQAFQALQELADNTLVLKPDGTVGIKISDAQAKGGINKALGTALVWHLIQEDQTTKIFVDNTTNSADKADPSQGGPTDADVKYSPNAAAAEEFIVGYGDNTRVEKLGKKNAFIALGHELIHALRITSGIATSSKGQASYNHAFKRPSDGKMVLESVPEEEYFTVGLPDAAKKASDYGKKLSNITETGLRVENHLDPRAAYVNKDDAAKLKDVGGLLPKGRKR